MGFIRSIQWRCVMLLALLVLAAGARAEQALPSWADGPARTAIMDFVTAVTDADGPDYVPPAQRIATFDNDGTLWVEYPMYTQGVFALDRVAALAPSRPEWQTTQPFKGLLEGDMSALSAAGMQGVMDLIMATHAGMTAEQFEEQVSNWFASARDKRFNKPYTELIYQPQLELLEYLREHDFKTFIVSGGGIAFMRPITEAAYGIPPEQVVGSSIEASYQVVDGKPAIVRNAKVGFIDDKAGKPVGIYQHIGRRPILAFGNSDGDKEMIEYTTAGEGRRLGLFLHHTDAEREYAYDRESSVGKFDAALDAAPDQGWIIVDMKKDWKRVFAFQ